MISCTEFIPAYSQLFTFLEERYGREEVDRFWEYLFTPDGAGIQLVNFLLKEGIKGCYTYWSGSLNEEAADFSMYLNEKDGWFKLNMHECPSKGRLLKLQDTMGIVPYHDYCLHCDHYRESAEKAGFEYIYDFCGTDKASCSILIYDPKKFSKKLTVDADTLAMHRNAADNEYFHRDFHSSLNNGIHYLGEKYGEKVLQEFLEEYTNVAYGRKVADLKQRGIAAVEELIRNIYRKEKAEQVLSVTKEGGRTVFEIAYCPAVKHLHDTGRTVTPWFVYTTTVIMQTLASFAKLQFRLEEYDTQTGKARYSFC